MYAMYTVLLKAPPEARCVLVQALEVTGLSSQLTASSFCRSVPFFYRQCVGPL